MTAAEDIKTLLDNSSSCGLTFGTDLFIGLMPDGPDLCASVTDAPGLPPSPTLYYSEFVHILVRGGVGGYSEAASLAEDIGAVLHEYTGTPAGSDFYYAGVWLTGSPAFIGVDDKNRPMFSINLRIQRR